MAFEIRAVSEDEFESFTRLMATTFGNDYRAEMLDYRRNIIELDRTLGVFDSGKIVATTGIFTYAMTVPGGARIPTAGVTMVTVAPTHRRRGVLTSMMKRQLEDIRDRGEWAAALWASESQIYGRFGYGMAAQSVDFEIERVHAQLIHGSEAAGTIRNVDKDEAATLLPPIWDAAQRSRPGAMPRSDAWWEHRTLADVEAWRGGFTANRFAVYEEGGRALGYVRYRVKQEWQDTGPDGKLLIADLLGESPAAIAALWQFVFGIDLISKITIEHRPADEPLYWMLNDSRRLKGRPSDGLWLRLLDIPKALEARTYSAEGRIVLDVTDGFCPWAGGRFELNAEAEQGTCRRTDRTATVKLGVADLGALYLGGARVRSLVDAGRVTGEAPALRLLERMFASDIAPWCFEVF
jgi:predicted acetyltransferase